MRELIETHKNRQVRNGGTFKEHIKGGTSC